MAGYTNRQIRYYLQTHQVADILAFEKAKARRDEILVGRGDTDDDLRRPNRLPTRCLTAI